MYQRHGLLTLKGLKVYKLTIRDLGMVEIFVYDAPLLRVPYTVFPIYPENSKLEFRMATIDMRTVCILEGNC